MIGGVHAKRKKFQRSIPRVKPFVKKLLTDNCCCSCTNGTSAIKRNISDHPCLLQGFMFFPFSLSQNHPEPKCPQQRRLRGTQWTGAGGPSPCRMGMGCSRHSSKVQGPDCASVVATAFVSPAAGSANFPTSGAGAVW